MILKLEDLDESVHPFTISFGNKDVRITTNYDDNGFIHQLYLVLYMKVVMEYLIKMFQKITRNRSRYISFNEYS